MTNAAEEIEQSRRGRTLLGTAAIAACLVALGLVPSAAAAQDLSDVDLLTDFGTRIDGAAVADLAGSAVAVAGDINGDGTDDLIVGAESADPHGRGFAGSAYVVYGEPGAGPADLDIAEIDGVADVRGFRIDGASAGDNVARLGAVAGAGDVNGDGVDDVVVGAPRAGNHGRGFSGSAYVVYGARVADLADVDLAEIDGAADARGFRIDGAAELDRAGSSVAGAGDVNGDGVDDVIVDAPQADNHGRSNAGSAYVVYGERATDPADLDLAEIDGAADARGLRIDGAAAAIVLGGSAGTVAGAGDVNGDGIDDVIVGASTADNNGRGFSGSAHVVYGEQAADLADLDLAEIDGAADARGLRIDGAAAGDQAGAAVAGAGDVNGDGVEDVMVGAPTADGGGRLNSGSAYVVYGEPAADPADLDLAEIDGAGDARGLRIDGAEEFADTGRSLAGAGDVNGEGVDDVVVGASQADTNGRPDSGSAYVVYGEHAADPANVDLAEIDGAADARGFRIDGAAARDEASRFAVAGAGDVNGDGGDDVIVGAHFADNNGRRDSGSAYVVYGEPASNRPPDCSGVAASPDELWPPNHEMRDDMLSGAGDPDGDAVTLAITGVSQDEPVNGGGGNTAPDAELSSEPGHLRLRAERAGHGDGRVYRIEFRGDDGNGGECTGTATVGVPHDRRGSPAIDSAPPSYDSFDGSRFQEER